MADRPIRPSLGRHTAASDHGPNTYTLWPNGSYLNDLTPRQARVIRRALVADWRKQMAEWRARR